LRIRETAVLEAVSATVVASPRPRPLPAGVVNVISNVPKDAAAVVGFYPISNDAVMDDVKDLVFKTQVSLAKSIMQIDKREMNLTPGMSVTVEVKTGTRRVIEFFLAPLLRYKQESIRER
jgi:multidrug efflux pump subunit AcrA (membrane-fusion protein)